MTLQDVTRPEPAAAGRAAPARHVGFCDTPVGAVGVLVDATAVRTVGWRLHPGAASAEPNPLVQRALEQLRGYFAGTRRDFDLPMDLTTLPAATRAVLTALLEVPYGSTITYGELAVRSGTGLPARAIGSVMAGNPVPILVPCHRVVASDGLGGFSGGERGHELQTKLWLLEHEGAMPPTLI